MLKWLCMDKIAIISDIHGNLEALQKVLNDIRRRGIQRIFCLGDTISKGEHQQECVDLVRENCEVVIQGNHDQYALLPFEEMGDYDQEQAKWVQSKLNDAAKDFMRNLPFCYEFYLSGRLVRLIHAHPESNTKLIGSIDKLEHHYELVLPSEKTVSRQKADIVIYGHIHMPFSLKIYNRLILNPGSVGDAMNGIRNPEKDADARFTTVANYLIIAGELNGREPGKLSYEFVDLPYDIEKELAANQDNIDREAYELELREGKYRNMDKIYQMYTEWGIDIDKI